MEGSIVMDEDDDITAYVTEEIAAFKVEFNSMRREIEDSKAEMQAELGKVKHAFEAKLAKEKQDLNTELSKFKKQITGRMEGELAKVKFEMQSQLRSIFRAAADSFGVNTSTPRASRSLNETDSAEASTSLIKQYRCSNYNIPNVQRTSDNDDTAAIPERVMDKIRPYVPRFLQKNESLGLYQVAWMHAFIRTHKTDCLNDSLILTCIKEGIEDKVWRKGWKPPGIKTSFEDYLFNKIKNVKKPKKTIRSKLAAMVDRKVKEKEYHLDVLSENEEETELSLSSQNKPNLVQALLAKEGEKLVFERLNQSENEEPAEKERDIEMADDS